MKHKLRKKTKKKRKDLLHGSVHEYDQREHVPDKEWLNNQLKWREIQLGNQYHVPSHGDHEEALASCE